MNQTDNIKNVSNSKENNLQADVVIVGTGVGGCFSALNLPEDLSIIMITKSDLESSDSFLAQGGICVLHDDDDYDSYFEDTMRAGHYENRKESVDIMIRGSQDVIHDLIGYGVDFAKEDGKLLYTREGAHSRPRILFHEDVTGKEISTPAITVGASFGDALMAASGIKYSGFESFNKLTDFIKPGKTYHPNKENHEAYRKYQNIYDSLYPATVNLMHCLSD